MSCRFVLLTNNPRYQGRDDLPVDYREGAAGIEIVTAGRDLIHLGWQLLKILPRRELKRIKPEMIEKYMPKD